MKKTIVLPIIVLVASLIGTMVLAENPATKNAGEAKFKELCSMCHPDGGNIVNPKKTLSKKDRDANNIKNEADIVKLMRKPGPGMTAFDARKATDREAGEIARYIVKTFK